MLQYTLARDGQFYKGNLHVHSTNSDGVDSPETLAKIYREQGYSFLAITDHNVYGEYPQLCTPDFLIIPGIEIDCSTPLHHVVGIGHPAHTKLHMGDRVTGMRQASAQELIDYLLAQGNDPIYAHPSFSHTSPELLAGLHGHIGMEILNYSSDQLWKIGNSEFHYEFLWNHTFSGWCFASDDGHGIGDAYCGGYITVKCRELTYDALFSAIRAGSFTASHARMGESAPQILDFVVEDGVAKLYCTPCSHICIKTNRRGDYAPVVAKDTPLTYMEYKIPAGARSICVICTDERRNTTWSQPILLA